MFFSRKPCASRSSIPKNAVIAFPFFVWWAGTAHHTVLSAEYSAHGEGHAIGFVFDHSDLNAFRHAFEVVVELASGSLAGADAGHLAGRLGMGRTRQESVAAGLQGVADGNGARMATVTGVISALVYHAFRDNRHFNANLFHGIVPFKITGHITRRAGETLLRK